MIHKSSNVALQNVDDELQCKVCLGYAIDPLVCKQCTNIFCSQCINTVKINKFCPTCNVENPKFEQNKFAAKMINSIIQQCPNQCGQSSSIGNMKDHLKLCEKRQIQCKICKQKYKPKEFVQHIAYNHSSDVQKQFSNEYQMREEEQKQECSKIYDIQAEKIDPIIKRLNWNRNECRLGATGKYYCGKKLNGTCNKNGFKNCCDGYCGTTTGCNCQACMKLDIEARGLQQGFLVNKYGFTTRKGATGKFYCGRKCCKHMLGDGWCGPDQGPQCEACQTIEYQTLDRYKTLVSFTPPGDYIQDFFDAI